VEVHDGSNPLNFITDVFDSRQISA
jgi:hypothetical protein